MPYRWPEDTGCTRLALAVAERWCRTCGGALTTCDHRQHRVCTLNGPLHLGCTLAHGPRAPARPLPRRCVQTPSPRSPGRGGASAGMGGVGWASAAVPATGQWGRAGPPWPTRPRCAVRRRERDVHAPLAPDAGRRPWRSTAVRGGLCAGRRREPGQRRSATGARPCNALRGTGPGTEPRLVCRRRAGQCDRRGAAAVGPGAGVGRALGHTRASVALRATGRVRPGHGRGVPRGATAVWPASWPAGGGPAGVGSRPPGHREEATPHPGVARHGTGSAGCAAHRPPHRPPHPRAQLGPGAQRRAAPSRDAT